MANGMTAAIVGENLVITVPLTGKGADGLYPILSDSGKTRQVASSHGNVPVDLTIGDQQVRVGVNAYIYAQPKGKR